MTQRIPWTWPYTKREQVILLVIGVWAAAVLGSFAWVVYGIMTMRW